MVADRANLVLQRGFGSEGFVETAVANTELAVSAEIVPDRTSQHTDAAIAAVSL